METLMKQETLTAKQALMVIEYFAQRAAEDAPDYALYEADFDKHDWLTCYQTSIAIERRITEHDWHTLLVNMIEFQSFDRDPEGWLHMRGEQPVPINVTYFKDVLEDLVSWAISNVYKNSGA